MPAADSAACGEDAHHISRVERVGRAPGARGRKLRRTPLQYRLIIKSHSAQLDARLITHETHRPFRCLRAFRQDLADAQTQTRRWAGAQHGGRPYRAFRPAGRDGQTDGLRQEESYGRWSALAKHGRRGRRRVSRDKVWSPRARLARPGYRLQVAWMALNAWLVLILVVFPNLP